MSVEFVTAREGAPSSTAAKAPSDVLLHILSIHIP